MMETPTSKSNSSKKDTHKHPLSVRVQALALVTAGIPYSVVSQTTRIPPRTLQYLVKKARERGFNPAVDPRIMMEYVEDGKRTGRPKKGSKPDASSGSVAEQEESLESSVEVEMEGEADAEGEKVSSSSSAPSGVVSGSSGGAVGGSSPGVLNVMPPDQSVEQAQTGAGGPV